MTSRLEEIKQRLVALDLAQEAAKPHYVTYMNTQHLPDMHGYPIARARQAIERNAPDDLRDLLAVVEAAVALSNEEHTIWIEDISDKGLEAYEALLQAVAKFTGEGGE